MRSTTPLFEFRSDLFAVAALEDQETRPHLYGRALAGWVAARLGARGYQAAAPTAHDWGWCVMLQRTPFHLWVACTNVGEDLSTDPPLSADDFEALGARLTWRCTVGTDVPPWTAFYWKRLFGLADTWVEVQMAARALEQILLAEPRIRIELVEGL